MDIRRDYGYIGAGHSRPISRPPTIPTAIMSGSLTLPRRPALTGFRDGMKSGVLKQQERRFFLMFARYSKACSDKLLTALSSGQFVLGGMNRKSSPVAY